MKKTILILVSGIVLASLLGVGVYAVVKKVEKKTIKQTSQIVMNTIRSGEINKDETWGGKISITGSIFVKKAVTLTIQPGTAVAFKHNRDYKNPHKLSLEINGTLKAIGMPGKPITFTSDA